jgi:uncharacterized DUF497 family protein
VPKYLTGFVNVWYKDVHRGYEMESFGWDEGNKLKNWIKHHVHRKECEQVFFDKNAVIYEDIKHSKSEKRYIIIGITNKKRVLHIAFTSRGKNVRVISARVADKKELKYYENTKKQKN